MVGITCYCELVEQVIDTQIDDLTLIGFNREPTAYEYQYYRN